MDVQYRFSKVLEEYRIFFSQVSRAEYFFVGGAGALMIWSVKFGTELGDRLIWLLGISWAFQLIGLICGGILILQSLEFSRQWRDLIIKVLEPSLDTQENPEEIAKRMFISAVEEENKCTRLRSWFLLFVAFGYVFIVIFAFFNRY